jgi:hypothetical protein
VLGGTLFCILLAYIILMGNTLKEKYFDDRRREYVYTTMY